MLRWVSSVRLAITLLAVLSIAAAIGGIIPQAPTTPSADLSHRSYGPFWYGVIRLFLLHDVFHSWWFITLLALFSVNLVICTFRRLRTSLRLVTSPLRALSSPDLAAAIPVSWSGTSLLPADVRGATRRVLKRRRVRFRETGDQFAGERWRCSRLAPDLVHLGILAILIGAFLGVFRFEGRLYVSELQLGEVLLPCVGREGSACVKNVPFGIRVDSFGAELHPGTMVYSYFWTVVTVIEDGEESETQRIELNRPLIHRGVSFYQSFYGYDLGAAQVTVVVVDWSKRRSAGSFTVNVGESFKIPETEDSVLFSRFFTSFAMDDDGRPVNINAPTPQNPAAMLLVYKDQDGFVSSYYSDTVFANYPAPHSSQDRPYRFYLENYDVPRYVGLTYSRDPGYPVVWWGFVLVMAGLFGVFYLRPRRVWVVFDPAGERLLVVGDQKSRPGNREWLEDIARAIERGLEGGG